jgi:hypothetical protein
MVAFKQLSGVIFAAIFLSIVGAIYLGYSRGSAKSEFERRAQELAEQINILAEKDMGTKEFFTINVPADCELRFEDNSVVAIVDGNLENHGVRVKVGVKVGENIIDLKITSRNVVLTLERTKNGVSVSE